jgi:hypothetical protein
LTGIYILAFVLLTTIAGGLLVYLRLFVPLRKKESGYDFVYIEKDGTVRELYQEEIEYLNAPFNYNDGARPIPKKRYEDKNPEGKISGFILRKRVPQQIKIIKKSGGPINLN